MRKGVGLGAAILGAAVVVVLWFHQVPDRTTPNDARAVQRLLPGTHAKPQSFEQEVALILNIQDRVLAASPEERGIPLNRPREIADLLRAGHGACFDWSRAIETALRSYSFRTRHASMYSTVATNSASFAADAGQHFPRTDRGEDEPRRKWSSLVKSSLPEIYGQPFTWVYGLYGRQGRFYPSFDPIPDVNWRELAQNV